MTTPVTRSKPFTDGYAAAARVFAKLRHDPAGIALTLGAPAILVLVFGYVFGSAISVPGSGNYREYLVPGLFVMIAVNPIPAMVSMARDAGRGSVDRFRSLPISRAAIPLGQAIATAGYGVVCLLVMALCGLLVGWQANNGLSSALGALALLVAMQFAFTWIGMYLGLTIGNEETASQLAILVFPLTMLSNVYVPTAGMPAWLRTIADWNPVSAFAGAVRNLLGNPTAPTNGAWPLENPVFSTLAWVLLLLIIFAPLCIVRYARSES